MSQGPSSAGPSRSVTLSSPRPSTFTYASPDLNVLITGTLLEGQELKDGAQFQLEPNGVYIQHPALTRVTKTSQSQTLRSLNTNQAILTLPTPELGARPPSPDHKPIITLHLPLLTFDQAKPLEQSPLYSHTFKILIDGPGFEPPRFDPHKVPGTPAFGPQGVSSPTIQRALLSPLLSPQRRASASAQGGTNGSNEGAPQLPLLTRGRSGSIIANGRDPSPVRAKGLEALLPSTANAPSLSAVALEEMSSDSKRAADEIMAIRRAHEARVRRVKSEQEVLEARAAYVNGLPIPTESGGVIVHGFTKENTPSPAASAIRRASASRERSADRSRSHDRSPLSPGQGSPDVSRGRPSGPTTQQDETASRKVAADDAEEERGRSRSRQRAGRVSSASRRRAQQAVAAAVEKVVGERPRSPLPAPGPGDSLTLMRSPKDKPRAGDSISATLEEDADEDDGPVATLIPEEKGASGGGAQGVAGFASASASFVPSSHVLVSVPEEEESTTDSPVQEPTARVQQETGQSDSESSSEHEDPFEMDEDLDVDDLTLPSAVDSAPVPDFDSPASPVVGPTAGPAQSFRGPSSMRQSNLSSSYAQLLSSSLANRPRNSTPGSPSFGFKSPPVLPTLSSFSATPSSPASSRHANETTSEIDAKVELAYLPKPDHRVTQESARQIRDLQALDAPSHRKPVPRRTSSRKSQGEYSQDEDDTSGREDYPSPQVRPKEYAVGSVPISMGFKRPGGASSFAPGDDPRAGPATVSARELGAHSYLPEGFAAKPRTGKRVSIVDPAGPPPPAQGPRGFEAETSQAEPVALGARVAPVARANGGGGGMASSLAQSLRNPPAGSLASRLAEEEEGDEEDEEEDGDEDEEDAPDGETGFLPPHEWTQASRTDEEFLSRSVGRD